MSNGVRVPLEHHFALEMKNRPDILGGRLPRSAF